MGLAGKLKEILSNDTTYYGLLVVLVAITSYGLGKHAVGPVPAAVVASEVQLIEKPSPVKTQETTGEASTRQLVASKNGTKYHFLWCPGASQMKEENKIYFDSAESARAAGYTPAANCKGLE